MTEHLQLSQLNELIRGLLEETFPGAFWVVAEITSIKKAASGHIYLELAEKENNKIIAKQQAAIWFGNYYKIEKKFGTDTDKLLKQGNKVLLKIMLDYHPVYGMKLVVYDLDPSITMGELEKRKQETILKLHEQQLLDKNAQIPLPSVLQRIAVISSPTAAGYEDFVNHLTHNDYAYVIHHTLFPSLMQGDEVERELTKQLAVIASRKEEFDAVVIIRGGGSKLDLEAFNNYNIAYTISQMPLPVLTGIGHQQDESVADMVAHTPLKTPTAVATFIIDNNVQFEYYIRESFSNIQEICRYRLQTEKQTLEQIKILLHTKCEHQIRLAQEYLEQAQNILHKLPLRYIQQQNRQLELYQKTFHFFDPDNLLKKGFSITRLQNGKIVRDNKQVKTGDILISQLYEGQIKSEAK